MSKHKRELKTRKVYELTKKNVMNENEVSSIQELGFSGTWVRRQGPEPVRLGIGIVTLCIKPGCNFDEFQSDIDEEIVR